MNENMKLSLTLDVKNGEFKAKIKDSAGNITELGKVGAEAGQSIDGGFAKAKRGIESISQSLKQTRNELIGFFSISKGFDLAKSFFSTNVEMDRLRGQLVALTGSTEKAKASFDFIKRFATDTPFEIKGLTEAFISLGNFGITPTAEVMGAITNQAAKLGGSQETLTGITLALGQAWSKSKLQGEEILQLIDRGVPAWKILEEVTGKNAAVLADLASKGELGRDVIAKFIDKMGELSAGSNAAAMETLGGKISNLSDAWTSFQDTLLQDKSEGVLKSILSGMGDTLNLFTKSMSSTIDDQIATLEKKIQYRDFGFIGKAVYSAFNLGSTVDQKGLDDNDRKLAQFRALKVETDAKAKAENEATNTTKAASIAMAEEAKAADELSKKYNALEADLKAATNEQLARVNDRQAAQTRTTETSVTDVGGVDRSRQREQDITRAIITANSERSRIESEAAARRIALIDSAYKYEVEAAKKSGKDTAKIDQNWLASKQKAVSEWTATSRKSIEELTALEKKYAEQSIKYQNDILDNQRSTQQTVAELKGQTTVTNSSDLYQLRNVLGETELKTQAANAQRTGDLDGQVSAARKLQDVYKQVATSAKQAFDAGNIDEGALRLAIANFEQQSAEVDRISGQLSDAARLKSEEAKAAADEQRATLETANALADEIQQKLTQSLSINVDTAAIDAAVAKIDAIPTEKTVTINTVSADGQVLPADQTLPGYADGVRLDGFGGGDRHPALLESGEGVVNKYGMRALDNAFGPGFFDGINAGSSPIELLRRHVGTLKLAEGGRVALALPSLDAAKTGKGGTPINIHLPSGQQFGPFVGTGDAADALQSALSRESLARGRRR